MLLVYLGGAVGAVFNDENEGLPHHMALRRKTDGTMPNNLLAKSKSRAMTRLSCFIRKRKNRQAEWAVCHFPLGLP